MALMCCTMANAVMMVLPHPRVDEWLAANGVLAPFDEDPASQATVGLTEI